MAKTLTIRRLGVLSLAKIQALVMGIAGLIVGLIYGVILMIVGAAVSMSQPQQGVQNPGAAGAAIGLVGGLMMVVLMPVIYATIGFVAGALGAVIYNLAAGWVGGLEIDVEGVANPYDPPGAY